MAGYTGSIADAGRVIHIAKRRERAKEDIERQRAKIREELTSLGANIGDKFAAHYDAVEAQIKSSTVGLVTLEQMKARREEYVKEREKQLAHKTLEAELKQQARDEEEKQNRSRVKKSCLSFDPDEGDDDDSDEGAESSRGEDLTSNDDTCARTSDETLSASARSALKRKIGKDPTVDTSFLPDKQREEEENRFVLKNGSHTLREQLRQEWSLRQEQIKNEEMNIAFSYWDGSGHRRDVKMKKGQSIHQLLQTALEILRKDFNELRAASADTLMFVKEDLIIPHFYTFYDFIVTKAMGKTGPLFEFDAAGDLRIKSDAAVDAVESHPAKIVLRGWFERNKHIYPASRWEPFDPAKKYSRTIDDLKGL